MEYKLVLLGDCGVGKSTTTMQYIENKFVEDFDPTVEDVYRKQVLIDDEVCVLSIFDTPGGNEYESVRDNYNSQGHGFIFMFSLTSKDSFENILEYYNQVRKLKKDNFAKLLIGNKCDLDQEREILTFESEALANSWNCGYMETSARENINIEELFCESVREARKFKDSFEKK